MSQKPKSIVFNYFELSEDEKIYVCQCRKSDKESEDDLCGALISAFRGHGASAPTRTGNLKRHLQRSHPKIAEIVEKHEEASNKPSDAPAKVQKSISTFMVSDRITVEMTEKKFKECIIEMVVVNALPFTFFSSPAFKKMNGEMAQKFGVSLSWENIRHLVLEKARLEKEELKRKLKNTVVFLKMDACTRQRVNYLAINVQFMGENQEIVIYTLTVKDTQAQHASQYIKELVKEVLNDFELSVTQVLAIVTDNASNMVSTVEKLNAEAHEKTSSDEEEFIEEEIDNSVEDAVNELSDIYKMYHMRCAVHTLQLAVRDGLKQRHASSLIGKVRRVAVAARAPKLDDILRRREGKGAILDQATRWGSTYQMIERILELKATLVDMASAEVALTELQWNQIEELKRLLVLPFIATKNLQSADLTPGEFLKEWKGLIFKLSNTGGLIANEIVRSMQQRERLLLENNDVLLAAVYVDPNCRILLDDDQCTKAKKALSDVAIRLHKLQNPEDDGPREFQNVAHVAMQDPDVENQTDDTDFEKHLDRQEQVKRRKMDDGAEKLNSLERFRQQFDSALKEVKQFDRTSRLTLKQAISMYPDTVKEVAATVSGLPATQVSVERLFSALRIIKSDLRGSLKEDTINAILFLRANWKIDA